MSAMKELEEGTQRRRARRLAALARAALLTATIAGPALGLLTACDSNKNGSKLDEAVEELKDEAEDAKDEIKDEIDDHT